MSCFYKLIIWPRRVEGNKKLAKPPTGISHRRSLDERSERPTWYDFKLLLFPLRWDRKTCGRIATNYGFQKAGPEGIAITSAKSRARGKQVTGTLAARTLMREARRASLACVRVLWMCYSWFIMERGNRPSSPVERSWQLYDSVPRIMRMVP
jgi:hypothetical protein